MNRSNLVDMGSFMDDLKASKDDNLRSVMNSSSIIGKAPQQVVAPKDRNPQTIDALRQERMDVMLEVDKRSERMSKLRTKWDTKKLLTAGVGLFIISKLV